MSAVFERRKLLIDASQSYKDAFKDKDSSKGLCFYLPTDDVGDIVSPTKATRLERWVSKPDERVLQLTDALSGAKAGISHALIKRDGDESYALLVRSVAFVTMAKVNAWLYTLHRDPTGDLHQFETCVSSAQ